MTFLIDAQLPPSLTAWFVAKGHASEHVSAIDLGAASDRRIADYAEATGSVLVSKDEDFLTLRLPDRFALLWLRMGNATNRALTAWLDSRWPEIERLLVGGERLVEVR